MKKFDRLKSIQLIAFVVLTVLCALLIFRDPELFHLIGVKSGVRLLCIILWLALGLSFLFVFMDYSMFNSFRQEFRELDAAVHSDHVAGIANRYSSDMLIEKYLDKPVPDHVGCIMMELTNLGEINSRHGHTGGNQLIRSFSSILKLTSVDLCHIGRNGGNRFMALFENSSEEKMKLFLSRIDARISENNRSEDKYPIAYRYGFAYHEGGPDETITQLIALADRRIRDNSR